MDPRARILNAEFDRVTLEQSVEVIMGYLQEGRRGWLCTVNVAILMMMRQDRFLQSFVDRAAFVVADGQPLVWVAPIFGASLPARVAGVDLVFALSRRARNEGLSIGLLGGTQSIVEAVADRLDELHPDLRISYRAHGYFRDDEATRVADAIRASRTDILFVGMGVPRQELFIDQQWSRMNVKLGIGVGGSFDVLSGLRVRAPQVVQRSGMEWAFRLVQEPRRLWKRYLLTNSRFLYLVGLEILRARRR